MSDFPWTPVTLQPPTPRRKTVIANWFRPRSRKVNPYLSREMRRYWDARSER